MNDDNDFKKDEIALRASVSCGIGWGKFRGVQVSEEQRYRYQLATFWAVQYALLGYQPHPTISDQIEDALKEFGLEELMKLPRLVNY